MKFRLCIVVALFFGSLVAVADESRLNEPHLAYGPNDTIKLVLAKVLPKKCRLCAQGSKFRFCSSWVTPKTREIEVDLAIPDNTPSGDYGLFYEDEKSKVDLKNHFLVEPK